MCMNKLLLNNNIKNHINIVSLDTCRYDESHFKRLLESDRAIILKECKNAKKGYLFSVWVLDSYYYVIESLRSNAKQYHNVFAITRNYDYALRVYRSLTGNIVNVMGELNAG